MTPEERASKLGYAIATYPDDAEVEILRSKIAEAIREAVLAEREAAAGQLEAEAAALRQEQQKQAAAANALVRAAAAVRARE